MIFGKIDFLNLLPFHVFIKRYSPSSQFFQSLNYHKGVPSALNKAFARRRIDAAFISSITAQKCAHFNVGIVAKREVLSVLSCPADGLTKDNDSATSNLLAQILEIDGKILIGDKALRYFYAGGEHTDLGLLWNKKTNLPFVFALLCTHQHSKTLKRLSAAFLKKPIKIPHYILVDAAKSAQLSQRQILDYLKYISYEIGYKEKRALRRFRKECQLKKLTPSLKKIRFE